MKNFEEIMSERKNRIEARKDEADQQESAV